MTQPVQWSAKVLAQRVTAGRISLTLSAPGGESRPRPGQYAALSVGGPGSVSILRRTAWYDEIDDRGGVGGSVTVVADVAGTAGAWFTGLSRGDTVDVIGPLGRPFSLPREPASCLLLGIGSGAAPAALLPLGRDLANRGCRVEFVFSPAAEPPYGLLEARRIGSGASVLAASTNPREVADALTSVLTECDPDVVYLSGTAQELAGLVDVVSGAGRQTQCAVDAPSVCGTGICSGCAIPVRGNDGLTRLVRVCTEGPVFNADLVRWSDLGTVPEDCVGPSFAGGQS